MGGFIPAETLVQHVTAGDMKPALGGITSGNMYSLHLLLAIRLRRRVIRAAAARLLALVVHSGADVCGERRCDERGSEVEDVK